MVNRGVLERVGSLDQVAGVRQYEIAAGPAKGVTMYSVHNRAGLDFSVVADKALDIFDLRYRGMNLAFHTTNGLVHPHRWSPSDEDFYVTWGGGLLATCGLTNIGPSCQAGGHHPIHGRIATIAAHLPTATQRWEGDDLVLEVSGEAHETNMLGRHLVLRRTVSTTLDSRTILVQDTVANLAAEPEPLFLLYHVNIGYPLLDEGSTVLVNAADCDATEAEVLPAPHLGGSVTTTTWTGGTRRAAAVLVGREGDLGLALAWDRQELPYFHQWRSLVPGGYVVGLEPATTPLDGRDTVMSAGVAPLVPPYGSLGFSLAITVLDGADDIEQFCQSAGMQRSAR